MEEEKKSCPSAVCDEGAQVIGIVTAQGTVNFLSQPLPVTKEFIATAHKGRSPEKRFRFSNRCAENGCRQWTGNGCGIIEAVMEQSERISVKIRLPKCGIRSDCRWYYQSGADACAVCPLIVSDNYEEQKYIEK